MILIALLIVLIAVLFVVVHFMNNDKAKELNIKAGFIRIKIKKE